MKTIFDLKPDKNDKMLINKKVGKSLLANWQT